MSAQTSNHTKQFLHKLKGNAADGEQSQRPKLLPNFRACLKARERRFLRLGGSLMQSPVTMSPRALSYSKFSTARITKGISIIGRDDIPELPSILIPEGVNSKRRLFSPGPAITALKESSMSETKTRVNKTELKELLRKCRALAVGRKGHGLGSNSDNLAEHIATKYTMNLNRVEEIINTKLKEQLQRDVDRMKNLTINDVAKEIDEELQRKQNKSVVGDRPVMKFTAFELVEQEFKNSKVDPDDPSVILNVSNVQPQITSAASGLSELKGEQQSKYNKVLDKFFTDVASLHRRVNSGGVRMNQKKDIAEKMRVAVVNGNVSDVMDLLNQDSSLISHIYSLRETPLLMACRLGNAEMVETLLRRGANPKARDFCQRSCRQIAQKYKHRQVIEVLRDWKIKQKTSQ